MTSRDPAAAVDEQIMAMAAERGLDIGTLARAAWPGTEDRAARARLGRTRRGGVWLRALVAIADALKCDVEIRLVPREPGPESE